MLPVSQLAQVFVRARMSRLRSVVVCAVYVMCVWPPRGKYRKAGQRRKTQIMSPARRRSLGRRKGDSSFIVHARCPESYSVRSCRSSALSSRRKFVVITGIPWPPKHPLSGTNLGGGCQRRTEREEKGQRRGKGPGKGGKEGERLGKGGKERERAGKGELTSRSWSGSICRSLCPRPG